ncbi:class I SAM-dependent methyltransferase [Dactylosporangium sp. AC04546]|uniref:class I SAM-dependent methyltransferase n=1 Tax=Dactylosporangium sp. AC04546 TaxID=2862460 RepID=UPI001EDDD521|nr:class I SAM-dependent methyltransferase [Dactylosporangium sp. AC04546]WVK87625.1 class I SAM-dependent methyltransferase [Dactylosporangium sp. AC04546]
MLEYRTLDPLQIRIDTHRRYSRHDDHPDPAVRSALGYHRGLDLLDVGCGTGEFLRSLAPAVGRLAGVDTSPAAVAALGGVPGVEAHEADAIALPFPDGSFDAVTARHMLYHVSEPLAAIREAHRVLRPGGRFAAVVNVPHPAPALTALASGAVADHGLDPAVFRIPVDASNLPGMVASVFGIVEVERHDNALVFPGPEPMVAYAVSMLSGFGVPDDHPLRPSIVDSITERAAALFASASTVEDPKGYVVVSAMR